MKRRLRQPAWYHFVLIGVGAMLLTFAIIGVILPPRYIVQREVEVMAPPDLVFAQLSDTANHPGFMPWKGQDPTVTFTLGAVTKGLGATYDWQGAQSRPRRSGSRW